MWVNMGTAEQCSNYKKYDKVSVTGVPVKIGDCVMLIADANSLRS